MEIFEILYVVGTYTSVHKILSNRFIFKGAHHTDFKQKAEIYLREGVSCVEASKIVSYRSAEVKVFNNQRAKSSGQDWVQLYKSQIE